MKKTIRHPTCDRMKHSKELFFPLKEYNASRNVSDFYSLCILQREKQHYSEFYFMDYMPKKMQFFFLDQGYQTRGVMTLSRDVLQLLPPSLGMGVASA